MRLLEILRTIAKFRLHEYLPPGLRVAYRLVFFWQPTVTSKMTRGQALRQAMESLGPVFIKLGQMLSVRRDLLPDDVADELSKLQDAVPPDNWHEIKQVIEQSFGPNFFSLFQSIAETPLASASIAQVHNAIDSDGNLCVIKIVRPKIEKKISRDIKLARLIARVLHGLAVDFRRMRLPEVISNYDQVIHDELDLLREAANMSEFRRNFKDSGKLYVPEPDWERSSEKVLTMERIAGVPINQVNKFKNFKVDLKKLGELGVEIFFTQVFRDNFFHADMHPGNIFVNVDNPDDPSYVAVDFGIVGSLTTADQAFVAEGLLAFFNTDYHALAKVYIDSGWVRQDVHPGELQSAFRTVLEPVSNKPIADISLGKVLLRLFKVSKRFGMEIQPQLILLDKTLLYIEGVGKQLYPELDLWQTAKPFLEKWLDERLGFKSFLKHSAQELPKFLHELPQVPVNLSRALTRFANGEFKTDKDIVEVLNKNQVKTTYVILSAGSFVAGSILIALDKIILGIIALIAAVGLLVFKR